MPCGGVAIRGGNALQGYPVCSVLHELDRRSRLKTESVFLSFSLSLPPPSLSTPSPFPPRTKQRRMVRFFTDRQMIETRGLYDDELSRTNRRPWRFRLH